MMKSAKRSTAPEARSEGLIVRKLPDEVLVYDLERHKAHCLGSVMAAVWDCCDGKASASQIARRLSKELGISLEEETVGVAVHRLSKARLLKQALPSEPGGTPTSRREWLRKAAAIVGLSILSITAPTLAQAATCITLAACTALPNNACGGRPCCSPSTGTCRKITGACRCG